jgi:hypothetical protein
MESTHRIFREKALEKRGQGVEEPVTPIWVKPERFALLWGLALLSVVSVGLIGWAEIPVHAVGIAAREGGEDGREVAILLPADSVKYLRVGQRVHLELGRDSRPGELAVTRVEPSLLTVEAARRRFRVSDVAHSGASFAVVHGICTAPEAVFEKLARAGLPARAEVGKQRLGSLLSSAGTKANDALR